MKPEIVFAVYRPHAGKPEELRKLVREHVPTLRSLGLLTDRPEILVQSGDGSLIEVFEWKSGEAASQAHEHPVIAKVWERMAKVCSFGSLDQLAEARKPFAHFVPVQA